MNKFFAVSCAAAAAVFTVTPASAAAGVVVHDIIVQRGIWVQLMGLFGY